MLISAAWYYSLFAELFVNLNGPRGHAGIIVPSGIATDATTAPFFSWLIKEERLSGLISFENEEFIFPAVHHSFRFCIFSVCSERQAKPMFAFFLRNSGAIRDKERYFSLSADQIDLLSPNTGNAPVFRSNSDALLTAKIYTNCPVLVNDRKGIEGNPWRVEFRQGLFNMASDSAHFRTAKQLADAGHIRAGVDWVQAGIRPAQAALSVEGGGAGSLSLSGGGPKVSRYVPLYEAKMIHQYDHRWAGYDASGLEANDIELAEKMDRSFEPTPRYWVPEGEVNARLTDKGWNRRWLIGWRDITSAHVFRTVISTVFPRAGVGDTLLLKMPEVDDVRLNGAVVGNLCSLVLDFAARQKVGGTHLKYNVFKQLPILPPAFYSEPRLAFITPKVLELTYTSHSLAPFARDLGHDGPPFVWDDDRRALLRADLDAFYARAYGLTRDELRYILDPADVKGPDYPSETFRVLKEKEIRHHGEYRTRRLVLAAWDRMAATGEFAAMGM